MHLKDQTVNTVGKRKQVLLHTMDFKPTVRVKATYVAFSGQKI
jgi:hypothetical protein